MTLMFLTNLMPIIAVCLVWRFLFHPFGLVNQLLGLVGFGRINWLTGSSDGDAGDHHGDGLAVSRPISWSYSSPALLAIPSRLL